MSASDTDTSQGDADTPALSAQDALVATMIAVSASDADIRTSELVMIQSMVNHLPAFADFDPERLQAMSRLVFDLFEAEEGLDALLGLLKAALPPRLRETAYTFACDVAAADGAVRTAELRLLEELREEFELDRLHAAAIERAARARYQRI